MGTIQRENATLVLSDDGYEVQISPKLMVEMQREIDVELTDKRELLLQLTTQIAALEKDIARIENIGETLSKSF